jgi:signal peptidase I
MNNNMSEPEEELDGTSRMQRKADAHRREVWGWVVSLIAAVAIALALRFFVFEFIRVEGSSMEPTLYTNEYVFMEKVTYWFSEPKFGDIVICYYPHHNETFVKRVIGTEGDTVEVRDGTLFINNEPNTTYFAGYLENDLAPVVVPQNSVFVMGDNRNASMDSTNSSIGPLSDDMILGKALFVIWPVDKIQGL